MSSHVPGNVSTYNEEMAPLIEKLKQSYKPVDAKAAFNQLLDHLHNDELDACIDAGEELLKERIPDSTRTRVHILIASCLADPDEMEEHYEKALDIWTLLNAQHGENARFGPSLREARAQLDVLRDAIREERNNDAASDAIEDEDNVETDQSVSTSTSTKLSMSAITAVGTSPTLAPSSTSGDRSSSHDSTSEHSHTLRTRSTDASLARSSASASSTANSVLSATTSSPIFGAIASPGQQTLRLNDRVGMSPANILKLAWDPNRTVQGRTASSKTLPSRPLKRRASST